MPVYDPGIAPERRPGVVMAIITVAVVGVIAGWCYMIYAREAPVTRKDHCLANVKVLAMAVQMYAADYDGRPPTASAWPEVLAEHEVGGSYSTHISGCGEARGREQSYAYNRGVAGRSTCGADTAYVLSIFESDAGNASVDGKELLPASPRHMGGDNVGFLDGHAKWWRRPHRTIRDQTVWEKDYGSYDGFPTWDISPTKPEGALALDLHPPSRVI